MAKTSLKVGFKKFNGFLESEHFPLWLFVNHHRTFTNKKMTLNQHYYLKEFLTDRTSQRVVKKSTQGGISECLIILAWSAAFQGNTVLYVLPTHLLMQRFVSNRFEKSILYSPYYRSQRSVGRAKDMQGKKDVDNRALKDIGSGVVSFAGSGSDVPFIEIPADWIIVDEADLCDSKRLELAKERLGHSHNPHEIYVGNPTYQGSFLDEKFKESTQGEWYIKADCGHRVKLDFFEHVVRQEDDDTYILRDKDFEFNTGQELKAIWAYIKATRESTGAPIFDKFTKEEFALLVYNNSSTWVNKLKFKYDP